MAVEGFVCGGQVGTGWWNGWLGKKHCNPCGHFKIKWWPFVSINAYVGLDGDFHRNITSDIQELKIIENFEIQESEDFQIDEEENTLSILSRYIDESEFEFDKTIIKGIFQDLYQQACEVE